MFDGLILMSGELYLKHTTTLFAISDKYILSREWIIIVDQVQTN